MHAPIIRVLGLHWWIQNYGELLYKWIEHRIHQVSCISLHNKSPQFPQKGLKIRQEIIYLINTAHWSKHGNAWMDYCKSLCVKRIFIKLLFIGENKWHCLLPKFKRGMENRSIEILEEQILTYMRRWYYSMQWWE
jgi:hypothetical protein